MALDGALLGFELEGLVYIDLRLQFGWRNSPGWWDLFGAALIWKHNSRDARAEDEPTAEAAAFVKQQAVQGPVPSRQRKLAVVRYDAAALRSFVDARRCSAIDVDNTMALAMLTSAAHMRRLSALMVTDHFELLGPPSNGLPPVVAPRKLTG